MRLIDIMSAPWAIVPEKLIEIRAIYATHLCGEKIDLKALEARLGEPLARAEQGYTLEQGVAIIPIEGHRDRLADANRGVTFGFTAEWGTRVAGNQPDADIGLRGGQRVRVGESVKELLTANDLGYLFTDAVA